MTIGSSNIDAGEEGRTEYEQIQQQQRINSKTLSDMQVGEVKSSRPVARILESLERSDERKKMTPVS